MSLSLLLANTCDIQSHPFSQSQDVLTLLKNVTNPSMRILPLAYIYTLVIFNFDHCLDLVFLIIHTFAYVPRY